MKNRALALTRGSIPYIKELRAIAGSVTAAILMQQLDYWFNSYPNGFYKFLFPCDNENYKQGASWSEELGFSKDEFRGAFDKLGWRYESKRAFDAAEKPFLVGEREYLYVSYHDKIKGLTYYFRNHDLVDKQIGELFSAQSTEVGKPNLRKSAMPTSVSRETQSTEVGKPNLQYKEAEITAETTSKTISTASPSATRENGQASGYKNGKQADPFFESFASAYLALYHCPYQHKKPDFIHLASCKKQSGDWLTLEQWQVALTNYLNSDLGTHTLADLSNRFGTFYRAALDKYNRPKPQGVAANFSDKTRCNYAVLLELQQENAELVRAYNETNGL